MRRSDSYLLFTLLSLILLGGLLLTGLVREKEERARVARTREVVRRHMLTDLALFTEARYTRHPSQADRHAPFQDHPLSLEHFPSGTLVPPRGGGR